ncbi:hypothetical protein HO133_000493 [Letharia lupina]|uniref:Initiator tRNA phosphoribosyl transferase n=1 Tax=Letharia lupina TaxID=560253 RepID=A0A8H6CHH1_9LECA|nr:uncharacterized protein HO133_000493 [Letharia lupina]KAF6223650.1 hypothetical protein HO133_000493 [Letharia lupina]
MPDALSKTIPIWCAVINRLLFGEMHESHKLGTPKEVVGASEHAQIEALLYGFVDDVKDLGLDLSSLRSVLKKPLRPSWVTHDSTSTHETGPSTHYHTIICCTASRRVFGAEMSEDGYIQGAGDDSEGWSNGLTPTLFWRHSEQLLAAVEVDMPCLIQGLTTTHQDHGAASSDAVKLGLTRLHIGTLSSAAQAEQYDGIVICGDATPSMPDQKAKDETGKRTLDLLCGNGKLGSRALRSQLPRIPPFIASLPDYGSPPKILFVCPTGKDLSVGTALTVLCLFFDNKYRFSRHATSTPIDKALIRRRLALITTAKPDTNPSRSTLQSVHSFLMPRLE